MPKDTTRSDTRCPYTRLFRSVAAVGVHASADGFDFSRKPAFGNVGEAFVAQLGDMVPGVGKTLAPVGFKVVKVDVATGVVHDFAVNRGELQGPASWGNHGGLERPVAVRFDPARSEEHTSELQSLMRISYAVFCLNKNKTANVTTQEQG